MFNSLYQQIVSKARIILVVYSVLSFFQGYSQASDSTWISTGEKCKIYNPYPDENEEVTWTGECKDGFAWGTGLMKWLVDDEVDAVYDGEMQRGLFHGEGKYWSYLDGDLFSYEEGQFEMNELKGKGKEILFEEGDTLLIYWGEFSNGKWNGQGIKRQFDEGLTYVNKGTFKNNEMVGIVECWTYQDDQEHWYFEGPIPWEDSSGIATEREGLNQYHGESEKGEKNGKGTLRYNGKLVYDGDWKDDKFHGLGHRVYPNGDRYIGEFKNGRSQGFGIFQWNDGTEYVGKFERGLFNGPGYVRKENKLKVAGIWKNGDLFQERPARGITNALAKKNKQLADFYEANIQKEID